VTCDEVRDRLAEHALGTLGETDDVRIRRHLRGCAQCRREFAHIGEGLTMFAAAAHDREPPQELRARVLGALADEWREDPVRVSDRTGRARTWLVAAAACVALLAVAVWGVDARSDARAVGEDATSYRRLLQTLGGEEFRVGALDRSGAARIDGSVVLYDSSVEQSWGVVLVRAPELTGVLRVTLEAADGRTIELHEAELDEDGSGATWLVTSESLQPFDHLTISAPDGTALATAEISQA
jgi:hypothetical protein